MKPLPLLFLLLLFLLPAACRQKPPELPPGVDHYTCPMHPSVRSLNPKEPCPICGMDLVPVMKGGASAPAESPSGHDHGHGHAAAPAEAQTHSVTIAPARLQEIGVTFAAVERRPMRHTIRAVGALEVSKALHWEFVARVEGYVETLYVTSPGERVAKGQPLLSLYSPQLRTAEQEFVSLLSLRDKGTGEGRASTERLIGSSRERLRQWNVAPEQIAALERTREPRASLVLLSPFDGIAESVPTGQGRNVKVGDPLVAVADISTLWLWAEFFEDEAPMLSEGQAVAVTTKALPGKSFSGRVALVNPFVDAARRTTKARVDIANPGRKLLPGMYADAELSMEMGEALAIPFSAVMPTGGRAYVFVDRGGGRLEPRTVQLGSRYGDFYEVRSGLAEGERVVASANFLIDAEARLQGAIQSFVQ